MDAVQHVEEKVEKQEVGTMKMMIRASITPRLTNKLIFSIQGASNNDTAALPPPTTAGAPPPASTADEKPLSKSQMKKLKKQQIAQKKKLYKRKIEKERKKEKIAARRNANAEKLAAMSPEEVAVWREEIKVLKAQQQISRKNEKVDRNVRLEKAMQSGQRIVIDLDFFDKMTASEMKSMCQQVSYCYHVNCTSSTPCHLILSGVDGKVKDNITRQLPTMDKWKVTTTSGCYTDIVKPKEDLVYLTADSEYELKELDPTKAYIVGGIVDRNRHKNLCKEKAEGQGIATARLPIGEYLELSSSKVMCTNHVLEIMVKYMEVRDWKAAFESVIPLRKKKSTGDYGGDDGEVGGKKEEGVADIS